MNPLRIGITGATGFLGRHLVAHLVARGYEVRSFQRSVSPEASLKIDVRTFAMPQAIDPVDFSGLEFIIHAAVAEHTPQTPNADAVNREGTRQLLAAARAQNVRVIFLSTLSAHEKAESHYGRSKLEVEAMLDPSRDCILRLGLVLGHGGLFTGITDILKTSRIIPLPGGGGQPVQVLWMEDFLNVVDNVVGYRIVGRFDVAAPPVYTMRQLYETILRNLGITRMLVPVPLGIVQLGVSVLEALRIPFPIRSENVLGLKHMCAFDTVKSLQVLGLNQPVLLEDAVERLLRR